MTRVQASGRGARARAELTLALHAYLPASRANGPGRRAVLWVQG